MQAFPAPESPPTIVGMTLAAPEPTTPLPPGRDARLDAIEPFIPLGEPIANTSLRIDIGTLCASLC